LAIAPFLSVFFFVSPISISISIPIVVDHLSRSIAEKRDFFLVNFSTTRKIETTTVSGSEPSNFTQTTMNSNQINDIDHMSLEDNSTTAESAASTEARLDLSPRTRILTSVQTRVARYVLDHTDAANLLTSLSSGAACVKPRSRGSGARRKTSELTFLADRREDVVEMFLHALMAKNWR
jgi:hypothetical protein